MLPAVMTKCYCNEGGKTKIKKKQFTVYLLSVVNVLSCMKSVEEETENKLAKYLINTNPDYNSRHFPPTCVEDMYIDLTERLVVLPRAVAPKGVHLVAHCHRSVVDPAGPALQVH